jgi:small subunit ribosomal protein S17
MTENDTDRGRRKVREGYVVSDKMDKTVVVVVEDRVKHRLYGKVLRQTSRLKAPIAPASGIGSGSWRPAR